MCRNLRVNITHDVKVDLDHYVWALWKENANVRAGPFQNS